MDLMAASASPFWNNSNSNNQEGSTSYGNAVQKNYVVGLAKPALIHNPGLSDEWTADEQSLLEDLLSKYASDSSMVRCAKIANELQEKNVRDVALRVSWMTKNENGKQRKEDNISSRKSKDKKKKVADPSAKSSSHVTNRSNDGRISYKDIGGISGQLLEQNAQALHQISANFSSFKIHENLNLFTKARNNIQALLNDLNDMPEVMKKMPPLPVKLNEELVNLVLPGASMQKKY